MLTDYKRIYIIGNGGSYANAAHICNDFLSVGLKAHTMDPATLTAFSNDYGYEHAFSKWLSIVAERRDLLIALSGSGKSPNILRAVRMAEMIGMDAFTLFGAPHLEMQAAEEQQLKWGHEQMLKLRK